MNDQQILEALKVVPLSEEEKTARHILGRLYGPIATSKESTRNGRKYNAKLWQKALDDEVFHEKIANKSLFLELGHPIDREETDLKLACACIPEMPKIVDGDLYAYIDILDTENGRLLKTLCDYGFIPGISSRGSGDIMPNDEVDPDTFFLETWDIVALPAVKKARLAVCESFNGKTNKSLEQALAESFSSANDKEKKIMKESLDRLGIGLTEADFDIDDVDLANIPQATGPDVDDTLFEADEGENKDEEPESEIDTEDDDLPDEVDVEATTVEDFLDVFSDEDPKAKIIFAPIVIGDTEYQIDHIESDNAAEKDTVILTVYTQETGDNIDEDEEKISAAEAAVEDADTDADEADDDGSEEEVLESLKTAIRMKESLEANVQTLRSEKAVSDAKVVKLQEEVTKYKTAFERVGEIASKANGLEKEVKALRESLTQKDKQINKLQESKAAVVAKATETNAAQNHSLKESLAKTEQQLADTNAKLEKTAAAYTAKLTESVKQTAVYKTQYRQVLEAYAKFRAELLGITYTDLTAKLNEQYSLADVDKACDAVLTKTTPYTNLPLGRNTGAKMKINESAARKTNQEDDLDDLLELAGLK